MARIKVQGAKEMWHHWTPKEAKVIGAMCYGSWLELTPIQKEAITQIKRPWLIYELYMKAVEKLSKLFEESPDSNVDFLIAHFDPATRVIDSGNVELDPVKTAEAKEILSHLFGKDFKGVGWGDEKKLQEYVDGPAGDFCQKYFGKKFARPKLTSENRDILGIEDDALENTRGTIDDEMDAPVEKKKAGRPRKQEVEV